MIHVTIKKDKEKPESIDKSEELCSLVLLVMLQCGGRGKIYHKPRSMLYGIDRQNLYHNNKKDNNIKMWGSKLFHYMWLICCMCVLSKINSARCLEENQCLIPNDIFQCYILFYFALFDQMCFKMEWKCFSRDIGYLYCILGSYHSFFDSMGMKKGASIIAHIFYCSLCFQTALWNCSAPSISNTVLHVLHYMYSKKI